MHRRRTVLALVAVVAVGLAGGCSPTAPAGTPVVRSSGPSPGAIPVTKVTDGDTIHVELAGVDERVRLIGVDTPEVDWYGGTAECYGTAAGRYARRRLSGRSVRLAFDVNRRDRYGRLLAYVYLGPELFNLTLVRLGYARADPVPPDTRMAGAFQRAEDQARSSGTGLWSACPS